MLDVLYALLILIPFALLVILLGLLVTHQAQRWICVLAQHLPKRQEIREQEWLAQLDELHSPCGTLQFVLGCGLATFRAQESQPRAVVHLLFVTLKWLLLSPLRVFRFFRVTEDDVKAATPYGF
ncbi:hypothetical protein [Deinococcus sp. QL22]|uniref:hypothetical protein n=1 Tax=Deinococcus sp. QL22 TaxID=2939437 RepID=UPI00201725F7|nr:hypothetical protein [Deinococcus sp. QL22]UQN10613.1 hypothetical protein M1R55_30935 [Deinococcus sp. QL22]